MANFQNNAITESGIRLRSHVDMGAVFTATKIVIGSGYIPSGKTAKTMTDVVSPVKELDINKKERTPDGKVVFGGVYTNEDIATEFYFRELALYAKAVYPDGTEVDEVLYSYGNAAGDAELMAAYSTSTVVERQMDIVTFIGNEAQVDLTIQSGLYLAHAAKHAAGGEDPVTCDMIGAVKKSGDTIGGNGKIDPLAINGGDTTTLLKFRNNNNEVQGYVGFSGQKAVVQGADNNPKAIYHEGNKPTATDTGAIPSDPSTRMEIPSGVDVKVFLANTTTPFGQIFQYSENAPINAPLNDAKVWWFYDRSAAGVFARCQLYPNRLWWGGFNNGLFYGWFEVATTDNAVSKTGDQTMTGSLTGRSFSATDGYMNGYYGVDGSLKRVEIRATNPNNGAMGALLVSPSGLMFMDGNGYEYRVVHEGNMGQFLGVAPATLV